MARDEYRIHIPLGYSMRGRRHADPVGWAKLTTAQLLDVADSMTTIAYNVDTVQEFIEAMAERIKEQQRLIDSYRK